MKKKYKADGLFKEVYVFDSSSLIEIEHKHGVSFLEKIIDTILISEKVAFEVAEHPRIRKTDPLRQFVLKHPEIKAPFRDEEEELEYL
ncbi:MAG: hypothetical protein AB1546_15110 [bacterium]